jgi:RimJ/RimL family protein N-acetyltransferase
MLSPLDASTAVIVASWLAAEENARWLDLGHGRCGADPRALLVMAQRGLQLIRVFTAGSAAEPAGVVALRDVAPEFGTATLWYLLGDKRWAGGGYTTRAVSRLLEEAFHERGLRAVNAWVVDGNEASRRVLMHNGFAFIGRQRRCHRIGEEWRDRLLFDLLASEHVPIETS